MWIRCGTAARAATFTLVFWMAPALAAAQPAEKWVRCYDGPVRLSDTVSAAAVDGRGNIFVTGSSYGNNGNADYATIAYDAAGNQLWIARYNGPGNENDWARAIAVDAVGNVYVTGASVGTGTDQDYATVAYDPSGNPLWEARYNGLDNQLDSASAIGVTDAGLIVVTGDSYRQAGCDAVTIAYDGAGGEVWRSTTALSQGRDLAVDPDGGIVVAGSSLLGTFADFCIVAYDASGNERWTRFYDGPAGSLDQASCIAIDAAGNVYAAGGSYGTGTGRDMAVTAYDAEGSLLWVGRYDSPFHCDDYPAAIAVSPSGTVLVTGYTFRGYLTDQYLTIAAFEPGGSLLWEDRCASFGMAACVGESILVGAGENVYVTGHCQSPASRWDVITLSYDPSGHQRWVKGYDGTMHESDEGVRILTDRAGDIIVAATVLNTSANADYAVIKYSDVITEVQFAAFEARIVGPGSVLLTWSTISERNTLGYTVYSTAAAAGDGLFVQEGFIPSHGPGMPYQHTVVKEGAPLLLYRIEEISTSGPGDATPLFGPHSRTSGRSR